MPGALGAALLLAILSPQSFAQNPSLELRASRTNKVLVHINLLSSCPTNAYTLMLSTSSPAGPWRDFEVNIGSTGLVSFRDCLITNLQYGYFWTRESSDEDFDQDGLDNLAEFQRCTDPANSDSDGDGLNDGEEAHWTGTNPSNRTDGAAPCLKLVLLGLALPNGRFYSFDGAPLAGGG